MSLPIFHSDDKDFSIMQTTWAAQLNPVINSPMNQSILLTNIVLANGADTVINHRLGRTLQGWMIVRQRASATVYDNQDSNSTPNLTLVLHASAAVTVDIVVF